MWRSWPNRDTIGEFTWFMRLLHRRVDSYLCCGSLHVSGEDRFLFWLGPLFQDTAENGLRLKFSRWSPPAWSTCRL